MHGRLKIKSTAQQKAEREEAQRKKLVAYQAAFSHAMSQRQSGAHDKDTLTTVAGILEKNPDVGVLWIYRREIFQAMRKTLPNEELQEFFNAELDFLVACLRVNPKSYFTWAHRCWILLNAPSPNWERELALCTRFLSLDERNFHCWDYRRWLVSQMSVCSEKELEFVTTKLYENFSNFSAWHYRSRLIPKATSTSSGGGDDCNNELPKNVLMEELDLVRNALFVDPTDQSPWFYYRWLLSNCTSRRVLLHTCLVTRQPATLRLAFSRPVPLAVLRDVKVTSRAKSCEGDAEGLPLELAWASGRSRKASALWTAALPDLDLSGRSEWEFLVHNSSERLKCELSAGDTFALSRTDVDPQKFFTTIADLKVAGLIQNELDSIRELYSMEPSSKWVVLGLCSLLRLTAPLDAESEVCDLLDKLRSSDGLRSSYYVDFRSRVLAENQVIRCFQASLSTYVLRDCGLTAVSVTPWLTFFTDIDLSGNKLKRLPQDCTYLMRLERLCLDRNALSSLAPLEGLPALQSLSAQHNALSKVEDVAAALTLPALRSLDLRGNILTKTDFGTSWQECSFEFFK